MKKFILSILIASMVCGFTACSSDNSETTVNTYADQTESKSTDTVENGSDSEETIEEDFCFMELDNVPEEWWSKEDEFGYTRKQIFDIRWEDKLGNTTGKLKIDTFDFSEFIKVEKSYYVFKITNNNFLLPLNISTFAPSSSSWEKELVFYVMGNNVWFYPIKLTVDNNRYNVEIVEGQWNTVVNKGNGFCGIYSYLPIDEEYFIKVEYPTGIDDEFRNNLQEKSDIDYYTSKYPYTESDLLELADKVTSCISADLITETPEYVSAYNVSTSDIALCDNTTVHIDGKYIKKWNSGGSEVSAASMYQGHNNLTIINNTGGYVDIIEYPDYMEFERFKDNESDKKTNFIYNGREIIILSEDFLGTMKAYGFMFEADGTVYEVKGTHTDLTQISEEEWLDNLCAGVISFK